MKAQVYTLFFVLFLVAVHSQAQDCNAKLEDAQQFFREGELREVFVALGDCLEGNKLNKDQRIEAYRLLTETYLFLHEDEKADSTYLELLRLSPRYTVDTSSNVPDLVYLSNTFNTNPIALLGFKGGVNYSVPSVLQRYALDNLTSAGETYTPAFGFQGGVDLNIPFSHFFGAALEVNYASHSYQYFDSLITSSHPSATLYGTLQFRETQEWLNVPLSLHAGIELGKFHPFIYGGASYQLLLRATFTQTQRTAGDAFQTSESISLTRDAVNTVLGSRRVTSNVSAIVGGGLKYRTGVDYFILDFRFSRMLGNLVNPQNRYSDINSLLYAYTHVDNDFILNNYAVSIGFVKAFYKPRKKRKYRSSE